MRHRTQSAAAPAVPELPLRATPHCIDHAAPYTDAPIGTPVAPPSTTISVPVTSDVGAVGLARATSDEGFSREILKKVAEVLKKPVS